MNHFFDLQYAAHILPDLARASVYTILITLVGFAIALVLGLVLAILRRSPIRLVSRTVGFVVEFIRSTPLLIQVYVLFYVLPAYGITMSALTAGTIGIALHYACYTSEVYRAGLNGVARGQWEAACALSLSPWRTYGGVILPQAVRPIIPALGNYLVAMFKDTPVLSAITVVELMQQAKNVGSETFRYLEPITLAGLFFLVISVTFAQLVRQLEIRLRLP
ncbi:MULTISPECIES: ectoine/hydroxyectoine ABC transporter permease subunit EhuD [Paraburkholderia]|jgi:polar amino acid transport system permease protein|uniref:Ectoine/hydroxyectoine ABC transporter permease subunit EhuD n=1 Tax=Paraburkholderia caribensis TaxID=75105 RepID=A0A9Q6S5D9_9BURK|nr:MULTISPECIES: ectoine/hydroxyectoine ABC transporter permease subunit EhuD [Paraburkholderia]AMV46462.1 ectoine/hydroxyectoine ABC transporter permease subunit EhuD [Paraburkholderia caribensis]PTB27196.1 ectoine/hydroxyectoine ABC transporter permease subunit EhuD [Paraburkholderia caribensis]QLB64888.1 ectoine/hydroxyectoine ABC transporter permease subunit EhuD [Paraburkholderia caribensis]CAG9232327.1 putative amino-acid ABC transporter permease protein y4tG [Paraburkholderia caribensis]